MKALIATMGLGLLFAGGAQAACSAADQAALEKLDRAWGDAARVGDRAALEQIYAEGFAELAPGAPSDRKAAIDAAVEDAAALKAAGKSPDPVTHDFYHINCSAHSALITHRNWGPAGEGPDAGTWQTRSVHQLEKVDGKWRVLSNATHAASDDMQVGYMDLEWNTAELKGDRAWFERNLADDYIGVSSRNGKREDKGDFLAEFGKTKVTVAETTDMDVQVDGDRALVTGIYTTRGTEADGKAFERRTRYIDSFVRRDGRWQIWSSQGTPIVE
jgi:ketosteroid isomerase-like protein